MKNNMNHDKGQKKYNVKQNESEGCMQRFSSKISEKIGDFFYRLGFLVATYPWTTIITSIITVLLLSSGFLKFNIEKNPLKLWVPQNSKFLHDTEWLMTNFEEGHREQIIIVAAPNVLEPKYLAKVAIINREISKINVTLTNGTTTNWDDVCFKIPFIAQYVDTKVRKKRGWYNDFLDFISPPENATNATSEAYTADTTTTTLRPKQEKSFNPSVDLPSFLFCKVVDGLPMGCYQSSLIDIWKYNETSIGNLTDDKVVELVNKYKISPYTGHSTDYKQMLGGIETDEFGNIVNATTLLSQWFVYVNFSKVDHEKIGNLAGTEDWASEEILLWEEKFLETVERLRDELEDDDFKIYYNAGRSYGDISNSVMFQDMDKLFIGGFLMFVYMQLVLSRFSFVEIRLMLSSLGLLCIGLAFLASVGICSILGISYGPVHTSLPFLLMGLGVDDMFVMMACWRKVQQTQNPDSIPTAIGLMLKHAGVSITVTSITDMVAFLVGATTILPSLHSFCIYAAIGVGLTYLLVTTMFVAIFTLDEQRIKARRNAVIPCIVHTDPSPKPCIDLNLMHKFLTFLYSKVLLTIPGKIIVILSVITYTGFAIEGVLNLEQKFDPNWFIPESTYLSKYIQKSREFYPDMGYEAGVYMGKLNYTSEMMKLIEMSEKLKNRSDLIHNYNSWIEPFTEFVYTHFDIDMKRQNVSETDWGTYLSKFLFSPTGGKYQKNFRFKGPLKCGEPTPALKVASIEFRLKRFSVRDEYVPAMRHIEHIVNEAELNTGDGISTVWGKIFGNWITDEIIDQEVIRNICLALVCVMFCTTILIVNFQICFWIFICVLLTLVNVGGYMQRWGLTIDLVSCIGLQLAVGLCVDYAAHIGHTFLTISKGNRTKRALDTVLHIGAAVLYGGGSTLLALAMLSGSEAYTFKAFFKIFSLVIFFGLFHGIVLLPVILAILGPDPYNIDIGQDDDGGAAEEMLNLDNKKVQIINGGKTDTKIKLKNGDSNNKNLVNKEKGSHQTDEAQPLNM